MGDSLAGFIIGFMIILFIAWIASGQYKDPDVDKGKFITPITTDGGGEVYDAPLFQ